MTDLQQEVFTSKDQALKKYYQEELKIAVGFFHPIVSREEVLPPLPSSRDTITMRFALTKTGENRWQYVLVDSEA